MACSPPRDVFRSVLVPFFHTAGLVLSSCTTNPLPILRLRGFLFFLFSRQEYKTLVVFFPWMEHYLFANKEHSCFNITLRVWCCAGAVEVEGRQGSGERQPVMLTQSSDLHQGPLSVQESVTHVRAALSRHRPLLCCFILRV